MILFLNDYSEGAHPRVLEGMQAGNLSQCCGYGLDEVSLRAHERVRALIGCPEADVHLLGRHQRQPHRADGVPAAARGGRVCGLRAHQHA